MDMQDHQSFNSFYNRLNWFYFLNVMEGLLVVLIDCFSVTIPGCYNIVSTPPPPISAGLDRFSFLRAGLLGKGG